MNWRIVKFLKLSLNLEDCVCITACPVKYCNDGHGNYIEINSDLYIGCGSCIPACTHKARYAIDDFELFVKEIQQGIPMVAIVAGEVRCLAESSDDESKK